MLFFYVAKCYFWQRKTKSNDRLKKPGIYALFTLKMEGQGVNLQRNGGTKNNIDFWLVFISYVLRSCSPCVTPTLPGVPFWADTHTFATRRSRGMGKPEIRRSQ